MELHTRIKLWVLKEGIPVPLRRRYMNVYRASKLKITIYMVKLQVLEFILSVLISSHMTIYLMHPCAKHPHLHYMYNCYELNKLYHCLPRLAYACFHTYLSQYFTFSHQYLFIKLIYQCLLFFIHLIIC